MKKNTLRVSLATLASVAVTRAMAGLGAGLLLSSRLKRQRRRRMGLALLALGAASTIPIGMRVFGSR
jgi:hypothetical protein